MPVPQLPRGSWLRAVARLGDEGLGRARRRLLAVMTSDRPEAPWACQQWLQTFIQRGDATVALTRLERLVHLAPDLRALALGYLFRRTGRVREAEAELASVADGTLAGPACELELAHLRALAGGGDGTRERIARAERRLRQRNDAWGLAAALAVRAGLALELGETERALRLAVTCERRRTALGDRFGVGYAIQLQAKALYRLGRYPQALAALQRALAVHEKARHDQEAGVVLNNIGLWHLDLANPVLAADHFHAAMRRFRRQHDRMREAAVTANLANARRQEGDIAAARRAYVRALALLPLEGASDARAIATAELAELESRSRRPRAALALIARERPALDGAGVNALGLVDIEAARARLRLGDAAGACAAATSVARRSERRACSGLPGDSCRVKAGVVVALAHLASGAPERASRALDRTERLLDRLIARQGDTFVRMGLAESYREVDDVRVAIALSRNSPDARPAWRAAARLKARELAGDDTGTRSRHGARATGRGWPSPPQGVALLEYHVSEETTRVFVVQSGSVDVVDIGVSEQALSRRVAKLLAPLRLAASAADPGPVLLEFRPADAARLHALLLAPALARLAAPTRELVVIPDGPLHALPFELLVEDGADGPASASLPLARFARVRHALDRFVIRYARSSRLLQPAAGASLAPRSFLGLDFSPSRHVLFATPEGPQRLAPLPRAGEEVAAIAARFPRATRRTGPAATPASYRRLASRHEVIHFAAHAFAGARAPGLAGVMLSGARAGSVAYLSAEEIRRLPLRAALVTLSACDSGSGLLRAREGALGLARAFLEAGADAVVASLWPVDDRAAKDLMQAFYLRLAAGQERARALAEAKRELREASGRHLVPQRAHPYYWAPFVLIDHRPRFAAGRDDRPERMRQL